MSKYFLRYRQPSSHQHRWPNHRVEAENFATDEVDIWWPNLCKFLAALTRRIITKTDCCGVIE